MKTTRTAKLLVLLLMATMVLTACGGNGDNGDTPDGDTPGEQVVWKYVHEEYPDDYQDIYAHYFKEELEARTNGQYTLEIYPVGQLGDALVGTELIQNGGVEMGITDPGAMGAFLPEANIMMLHFLLPDDLQKTQDFFDNSQMMARLNELHYEKNLKVLRWAPEGYFVWTGNRPLNTPEQFRGFKMRTMPAPLIAASFEAYGGSATPVPYAEVYTALQLGMVDGQTNPLIASDNMKFHEVCNYATIANADIYNFTHVINRDLWDSLDEEMQQIIIDADAAAMDRYQEILAVNDEAVMDRWVNEEAIEVVFVTDEERAVFFDMAQTVYDQFRTSGGAAAGELLDLYYAEIDDYK